MHLGVAFFLGLLVFVDVRGNKSAVKNDCVEALDGYRWVLVENCSSCSLQLYGQQDKVMAKAADESEVILTYGPRDSKVKGTKNSMRITIAVYLSCFSFGCYFSGGARSLGMCDDKTGKASVTVSPCRPDIFHSLAGSAGFTY